MHFKPCIVLAASLASALSSTVMVAAAASPASNNANVKRASLDNILAERGENFFHSDSHNTPRHARPIFGFATSSTHLNHKSSKRHSKRGTCSKRVTKNNSNNNGNSDSSSKGSWSEPSSSSSWSAPAAAPTETKKSSSSSKSEEGTISPITDGKDALGGAGLFSFVDSTCGKSGATEEVTKTSGPNGAMDWLNCGLNGNGWTPPNVHLKDVLVMSLDEALEDDNSPFHPCKPYLSIFDKYASEFDLPAILIAAIAMQESTCNKDVMGDNGGAYGLMQITQDKCGNAPNGDCKNPDYNIKTGTKYLKDRIDANNGNLLLGLGEYNGWYKDLTVAKATAIKGQCCQCQNNINYHMQMLNGWLLNKNGYELGDWNMGC